MRYQAIILTSCAMALAGASAMAQDVNEYREFERAAKQEYADFRAKANAEYAEFMKSAWQEYNLFAGLPLPEDDNVVTPEIVDLGEDNVEAEVEAMYEIDQSKVMKSTQPKPQPQPLAPISQYPWPDQKREGLSFYGQDFSIRFDPSQKFELPNLAYDNLAAAWKKMSDRQYDNTLRDCLLIRDNLHLNDWAYLVMVNDFANKVFDGNRNKAMLLTAFIATQSGYKIRLYKDLNEDEIGFMFASDKTIYQKTRWRKNNRDFYCFNDNKVRPIEILDVEFPKEQAVSLEITHPMHFPQDMSDSRTLQSKRYPEMKADVKLNHNLLKFYDNYPVTIDERGERWSNFANAPIDESVKEQLYPALKAAIAGKEQRQAANMLLNFVNTAFEYGYDTKIWGYDRTFFAEETLFYPYSDCEDRSVLYAHLVKDLLGIDAVLVHFPGHMSTAIALDDQSAYGTGLKMEGRKYFLADPIAKGAKVGTAINIPISKAYAIQLNN